MIIGLVHAQGQAFSLIHKGGDYRKISPNNYYISFLTPCPVRPIDRPAWLSAARADYHSLLPGRHMGRNKRKKGG